jgi:hypothetical protein|tara:strand:- start:3130 stop:3576 length:447 start_codon:yes stop_codon:yes gene_type:complete
MSATMASANLRATGAAPRVVARSSAASRVATMFRSAGPDAERKLGDAMVAAAGKFGARHQMEVKAALSEDAPVTERRAFLKKALLGVRTAPDPRSIVAVHPSPRHLEKVTHVEAYAYPPLPRRLVSRHETNRTRPPSRSQSSTHRLPP